jgi:tetratricopeptide (TPR) repeat protein
VRLIANDFDALIVHGKDLYGSERYAEARDAFREALAIGEDLHGPDAIELVEALVSLAMALGAKNHGKRETLAEELALHERALRITEAACGPDDPRTSTRLHDVALDLWALGRHDEALAAIQRSLAIAERLYDESHYPC